MRLLHLYLVCIIYCVCDVCVMKFIGLNASGFLIGVWVGPSLSSCSLKHEGQTWKRLNLKYGVWADLVTEEFNNNILMFRTIITVGYNLGVYLCRYNKISITRFRDDDELFISLTALLQCTQNRSRHHQLCNVAQLLVMKVTDSYF